MQEHFRLFNQNDCALTPGFFKGPEDCKDNGILHPFAHLGCTDLEVTFLHDQDQRFVEFHAVHRTKEEVYGVFIAVESEVFERMLLDCRLDLIELASPQKVHRFADKLSKSIGSLDALGTRRATNLDQLGGRAEAAINVLENAPEH